MKRTAMGCKLKNRDELISKYINGELPEEEAKVFEEHYFQCETCFNELRAAEDAVNLIERSGESAFDAGGLGNVKTGFFERIFKSTRTKQWSMAVGTAVIIIAVLLLTLPVHEDKKTEYNKTPIAKIDTVGKSGTKEIQTQKHEERDQNKDFSAVLSGPEFKPNPYLEEWSAENIRSGIEKLDTVLSPQLGEKFYNKKITFQWKMIRNEAVSLKILTNQEKEIFTATTGEQFPEYIISAPQNIFKHSGLYYWRIEDENEVLYVGKFYFIK